jgi:hypothetical protein
VKIVKELIEAVGEVYRAAIRQKSGYIFCYADLRGPASRQVSHTSSFEDMDAIFRAIEFSSRATSRAGASIGCRRLPDIARGLFFAPATLG